MSAVVLRRLAGSALLEPYPNLIAFAVRAEARPAFRHAFDTQRAIFDSTSAMER